MLGRARWALALAFVLLLAAAPSDARGRHGGGGHHGGWHEGGGHYYGYHGHGYYGPGFVFDVGPWWGPSFWWGSPWYGPPYYPPYYYPPPVIVQQQPQVYIERPPASPEAGGYWYYCQSAGKYYPNVATCPEPWVKVPPRSK